MAMGSCRAKTVSRPRDINALGFAVVRDYWSRSRSGQQATINVELTARDVRGVIRRE